MKALLSDKITRKTKTLFRSLSYLIIFYSFFSILSEQKIGLRPEQVFNSIQGSVEYYLEPMPRSEVFFHAHIRAFLELFLFYFTSSMSLLVFKSKRLSQMQSVWASLVALELLCLIALSFFSLEILAYIKSISFILSRLILFASSLGFLTKLFKNKGIV